MEKEKPLYIRFVKWGLANRFSYEDYDEIELHYKLPEYPKLYKNILLHELQHESGNFKFKDLKHDIKDGLKKSGLTRFMFRNPSTLIQLSPFWIKERKLIVDWSNLFMWIFPILFGVIIYKTFKVIGDLILLWLA